MTWLLDTNVISELRKARSGRADKSVTAWADQQITSTLYISAITVLELEQGVLQIERRDEKQGQILRHWLDKQVLPSFVGRVLSVDQSVAQTCAGLHVPDPRSERDAMIAATGIVHQMTIVTRNIVDFAGSGVKLVNPWDHPL